MGSRLREEILPLCCAVLCSGEFQLWYRVLCWNTAQEKHRPDEASQEVNPKKSEGWSLPAVGKKKNLIERWLFSLENKMLWRYLIATLQYLKRVYKKDGQRLLSRACDGTVALNYMGKKGRFWLDIGRNYLQRGWWNTGRDCPEGLWMPHPWKHPRSGQMGLWASCYSRKCAWSLQRTWSRWPLEVSCNPNHSMTLWEQRDHSSADWWCCVAGRQSLGRNDLPWPRVSAS